MTTEETTDPRSGYRLFTDAYDKLREEVKTYSPEAQEKLEHDLRLILHYWHRDRREGGKMLIQGLVTDYFVGEIKNESDALYIVPLLKEATGHHRSLAWAQTRISLKNGVHPGKQKPV